MERRSQLMCGPTSHTGMDIRDQTTKDTMIIVALLADPWFLSLWILQETI